ncbi:MAG: DNA/RNA non-specific endonuclease [Clostridia bacterium]|nr:DNA/RNA non-specific endonuclease [Clostridia bacterium]
MLPIRFVAEGLNLGVAWDAQSQRVTVIRNKLDSEEYNYLSSVIPQYSGYSYVTVNNNVPLFKNYEIIPGAFEYYSETDELGRCDVCMASVDASLMPTDSRESISSITPTGWINGTYDFIDGKYLYNRCHLIGYQLTGENANKSNLITGTRYMNVEGMLPFENMVDNYIEQTGNSVMYRVTPFFRDNNMVAEGVLLEAYSVEDSGRGISFCVYCYNVQPGVLIDYKTGNHQSVGLESSTAQTVPASVENQNKSVYRTPSGKRYHYDPECGGKNSYCIDIETALSAGLTPCQKCAK